MIRRFAFVIWFPVLATTLVIAFMALRSLTPVQSGPGGLTALANIPNYVILGICGLVTICTVVLRPKPLFSSLSVAIGTVVVYAAIIAVISVSPATGRYQTTVRVIDWSGRPIPNIAVSLSVSRTLSSFSGILAPSETTIFFTDPNGEFILRASIGQNVYCTVNALPKRVTPYRFASFILEPQRDNRFNLQHSWSNREFDPATNMHFLTLKGLRTPTEIKVFLPIDGGDDANPYL
jgi:hypothetical protein